MAMTLAPEQLARRKIDTLLEAAGWILQDNATFNRNAGEGVAVREFMLPTALRLPVVRRRQGGRSRGEEGRLDAERRRRPVRKYMAKLQSCRPLVEALVFDYRSTGEEPISAISATPTPLSPCLCFPSACTLHEWLKEEDTMRGRLRRMPPLDTAGLRDCQIEAIEGLEKSLAQDHPRALIQMATGAGKTFTACSFSWRLLKFAGAKRILFLVDRNNLGDQTLKEYQNYDPPGSGRKFINTYIVQHLHSNRIDPDAKVVITTIQRLYAMLRGEELDEEAEEGSAFETWTNEEGDLRPVTYALPSRSGSSTSSSPTSTTTRSRPVAPGAQILRRPPHQPDRTPSKHSASSTTT